MSKLVEIYHQLSLSSEATLEASLATWIPRAPEKRFRY
jgi:hypothetical protein